MKENIITVFALISLLILVFPYPYASAAAPKKTIGNFCNWKDLMGDYKDTDGDLEQDDFESFIVGQRITVIDVLEDFTVYEDLEITKLVFGSCPDEPALFGNTLDETWLKGKSVILSITIISVNESDNDPCEYYDISEIKQYQGGDDDNDDTETPSRMNIFMTVGIVVGIVIVLLVLFLVIWFIYNSRKENAAHAAEQGRDPQPNYDPSSLYGTRSSEMDTNFQENYRR